MSALEIARKKISFDVKKLSHFIWEGEERFNRFMAFQKLCSSDPLLRNNPKDIGIGRAETYELYAKKMKKLLEVADLRDTIQNQYFSEFEYNINKQQYSTKGLNQKFNSKQQK